MERDLERDLELRRRRRLLEERDFLEPRRRRRLLDERERVARGECLAGVRVRRMEDMRREGALRLRPRLDLDMAEFWLQRGSACMCASIIWRTLGILPLLGETYDLTRARVA